MEIPPVSWRGVRLKVEGGGGGATYMHAYIRMFMSKLYHILHENANMIIEVSEGVFPWTVIDRFISFVNCDKDIIRSWNVIR